MGFYPRIPSIFLYVNELRLVATSEKLILFADIFVVNSSVSNFYLK